MRILPLLKRMRIVLSMLFLLNTTGYAGSIITAPGLHKEIAALSSVKQVVYRIVLIDLNNCQSCNAWYPSLIKSCDTGIFVYFKGAKAKDKDKLAKRFKLAATRVIAGNLSIKNSNLITSAIYFETYENDNWVSLYTITDLSKVYKICKSDYQNDVSIESEDVFTKFHNTAVKGNYFYGITKPIMQLSRLHKDSFVIEIFPFATFDSFYWNSVFPNMRKADSTILSKTEFIAQTEFTNEVLSLFYPVNICSEHDRIFIATQPFLLKKTKNRLEATGINLIIEIDDDWNIINHWQIKTNNACSPIVGFSKKDRDFYFGSIDLDGQYFHRVETEDTQINNSSEPLHYDRGLLKKFDFLEYSSNTVIMGNNVQYFKNIPIVSAINNINKVQFDLSHYLGIQLQAKSFYNTLYSTFENDTLKSLCAINRNMVFLKIVSGKLISRRFFSLSNKYNPLFELMGEHGYLFYQTKEDFLKHLMDLE